MTTYSKLRRNKIEVDQATFDTEYERAYDFMWAQLTSHREFPYINANVQKTTALRYLNTAHAEGEKQTMFVARQSGFFDAACAFTEGRS